MSEKKGPPEGQEERRKGPSDRRAGIDRRDGDRVDLSSPPRRQKPDRRKSD